MEERIFLDDLCKDSVSLRKQQFIDGEVTGNPWRRAYANSATGRIAVENEVVEPYKSEIFAIWGNEPTILITAQ